MSVMIRTLSHLISSPARSAAGSLAAACLFAGAASAEPLQLHVRRLVETEPGSDQWKEAETTAQWEPRQTAVILCDMWDQHWCRGATARVAEMAPRMNQVVSELRRRGVLIIHCPSDTMKFYEGTPGRQLAQAAPKLEDLSPPAPKPRLPIDASDGGCDDDPPCKHGPHWQREIATLEIKPGDAIAENYEAYYLMRQRGITNIIYMGVHQNMCILNRPFGIRQMVAQGQNVVLIRDLTDSMYNSRRKPFVDHFTGNDLVTWYIEKYWSSTITSDQILGGQPFRFAADTKPPRVFHNEPNPPHAKSPALLTGSAQPVARNTKQLPPLVSPGVGQDHRITFRLRAPAAKKVLVYGDFGNKIAMESHEDGIWTATTDPAEPDLFSYYFSVDGTSIGDPSNPLVDFSSGFPRSLVLVPGTPPEIWEERDVPHGVVHQHWYESRSVGARRNFFVYTPPGYTKGRAKYPVLYLVHGAGGTPEVWTRTGRAHVIYDNLIADGKAVPAIIVMPDGHAPFVKGKTPEPRQKGVDLFASDLIHDIIPLVEREYRVSSSPKDRAIAGLSAGANQSAAIGLNYPEVFSQVGPFSGGGMFKDDAQERYARFLADPAASRKGLRLFWLAVGKDDMGVDVVKAFSGFLDEHQIKHSLTFTPGAHTWPVWRRNLREFAPLLFRP